MNQITINRDKCFLCLTYRNSKSKQKLFMYNFPRTTSIVYEKWLLACGINDKFEGDYSPKICSLCFEEKDFEDLRYGEKKPKLKNSSVPAKKKSSRKRHPEVSF